MSRKIAVPALVICAVARRWISVQYSDEASQRFTWPSVRGVPPERTVAVKVTRLPGFTVVTVLPPEVRVRVVVVGDEAATAGTTANKIAQMAAA